MAKAHIAEAACTRFKVKAHFKMKCSLRQLITVNSWIASLLLFGKGGPSSCSFGMGGTL